MTLMDLPDDLQQQMLGFLNGKAISTLLLRCFNTTTRTMPQACISMTQRVLLERLLALLQGLDGRTTVATGNVVAFLTRVVDQVRPFNHQHENNEWTVISFLSSRLAVLDYFEQVVASYNNKRQQKDSVGVGSVMEYPIWIGSLSSKRGRNDNGSNGFAQALQFSLQQQEQQLDKNDTSIHVQLLTPFWSPNVLRLFQRQCCSNNNSTGFALERNGYMFRTIPPMGRVLVIPCQQQQQSTEQQQQQQLLLEGLSQSLHDSIVLTLRRPRDHFTLVFCNGLQMHERSFLPSTPSLDPYNLRANSGTKQDLYFMFRHEEDNDDDMVTEDGVQCIVSLMRQQDIIQKCATT